MNHTSPITLFLLSIVPLVGCTQTPTPQAPSSHHTSGDRLSDLATLKTWETPINHFGNITLNIHPAVATWTTASAFAKHINDAMSPEGPMLAKAINAKTITVRIPENHRNDPVPFIARTLQLYIAPQYIEWKLRPKTEAEIQQDQIGQFTELILQQTCIDQGQLVLITNDTIASWSNTHHLANTINHEMASGEPAIAEAIDHKSIVVQIPENHRESPAAFIAHLMQLDIQLTNPPQTN